jgi:hypothetical protein
LAGFSLAELTEPTSLRFAATYSRNGCHSKPKWNPAAIRRTENHLDHPRSAIIRLVLEIARAGLSPLGQVLVQFMMVWQR